MSHPIAIHTLQFADLPLEQVLQKAKDWGYDGVELACRGDHFEPDKAVEDDRYVRDKLDLLDKYGLKVYALSTHLFTHCVADDPIDRRHRTMLPPHIWGDGDPEGVRRRSAEEIKKVAHGAAKLGVEVVTGAGGSSMWSYWFPQPPVTESDIEAGYRFFADRWLPILEVFKEQGVKYALEVMATQVAFDCITARRTLEAVNNHPNFGFNFDPSHFVYQLIDPVLFIEDFPDRIFFVHLKDTLLRLNGRTSILGSYVPFGDTRRPWDFTVIGRGETKWDKVLRALARIGYERALSVEWEDAHMDRDWGGREALAEARKLDFDLPATKTWWILK